MKEFKTPSYTSPTGGKRGCLCPDNTYSRKCCDGSLQAQGIGRTSRVWQDFWNNINRLWDDAFDDWGT
jgi:hypothetical protein